MPRKTRRSISLKGISYLRLKGYCEERGDSISGTVEGWIYEKLHKVKPKGPHLLYAVSEGDEPSIFVVAPSQTQAAEWASLELGTAPDLLRLREETDYDPERITYAYLGVLSDQERQELCVQPK